MEVSDRIKKLREENNITQQEMADKIGVSRAAIAKWETNKGLPDISNLIRISDIFNISLDELIKGNEDVKRKIISDSDSKKWHYLVIVYLISIIVYIGYFVYAHRIFMAGFLISTLFMMGFELRIFFKDRKR
ncbi:MAG: helix-turn-helix transcriptional regulator [Erysipelotrichaceae bacterium]|nr:helix-turn-helix transcriptional regulator [Erysipelotrichaceae bacterium]